MGVPTIGWRRRVTDHLMTGVAILTVILVLTPLFAIFGLYSKPKIVR